MTKRGCGLRGKRRAVLFSYFKGFKYPLVATPLDYTKSTENFGWYARSLVFWSNILSIMVEKDSDLDHKINMQFEAFNLYGEEEENLDMSVEVKDLATGCVLACCL